MGKTLWYYISGVGPATQNDVNMIKCIYTCVYTMYKNWKWILAQLVLSWLHSIHHCCRSTFNHTWKYSLDWEMGGCQVCTANEKMKDSPLTPSDYWHTTEAPNAVHGFSDAVGKQSIMASSEVEEAWQYIRDESLLIHIDAASGRFSGRPPCGQLAQLLQVYQRGQLCRDHRS